MNSTDRVYTGPRGKVAHLIPQSQAGMISVAACGLWAWGRSDWRGTGSQAEYEHAADLPLCKTCERKAKP